MNIYFKISIDFFKKILFSNFHFFFSYHNSLLLLLLFSVIELKISRICKCIFLENKAINLLFLIFVFILNFTIFLTSFVSVLYILIQSS